MLHHLSFAVTDLARSGAFYDAVGAFYEAALAHGGRDNGGAGLHSEYGPGYFAAFVMDPDGYRIEAVICGE